MISYTDIIVDTLLDTLSIFPLLLLVYVLLELLEHRVDLAKYAHLVTGPIGPLLGAVAGCVPQCGFSVAAATLYHYRRVGIGGLVAVFLATSDEAIPILMANPDQYDTVLKLIGTKIILACIWGYLIWIANAFRLRWFRKKDADKPILMTEECHHEKTEQFSFLHVLLHTLKISLYLFVTMLLIGCITAWLGADRISSILLAETLWQPVLAALIGLIPGCGTSILLTTLYLQGTLSFGAVTAGLCASAGFGYLILLQKQDVRTFAAIGATFVAAAISGIVLQLMGI